MVIPKRKGEALARAEREVREIENQYLEGLITDGERYNKVIDIWAQVTEEVAGEMMGEISQETATREGPKGNEERKQPSFNPIYIMADSGARGSAQQIRQLAGMRGLMAKPSGEIIETPITANFREGLTVLQYFISTHGARKGLADTALKTANSGYLTRRLVDVAQDAIITEFDCGTLDGIYIGSLVEGGEVIEAMGERILGRVALDDILDPYTNEVLVKANEEVDEAKVKLVENAGIDRVKIRSVLTCQARRGICVECYGRDLARGRKAHIGEAVGVIAAQSIGEPGTQLTMRTFHIGGTASRRAEQSTLENRNPGVVRFHSLNTVKKKDGSLVVMNRNGEMVIQDESGRERERYSVIYGAKLLVKDGQRVESNQLLAEWDPYAMPMLTEVAGTVKFGDVVEGVTMQEQLDEVTGLSRKVIIESKDPDARPRISIKDEAGETRQLPNSEQMARYFLPVGSNIQVTDGDFIEAGEVIAKIPRETTKTKDITGGLPRVAELFEARKPKEAAIISEIDGVVSFGKDTKGKRKVVVTPEVDGKLRNEMAKEYLISKGRHISVHSGDRVKAGEPMMDGAANPHDILRVLGLKELARYLVDEVQEVYRLQGVKINDKHIEVIVRQMLRRVRVTEVGDSDFLVDEQVEKTIFEEENARVLEKGGKPAVGEPLLLGITKASLSTESFISASSFQETTKVLTEAAISGKVDYLRGLKENVIMGRLIPAGTGLPAYKHLDIEVETPLDAVEEVEDALSAEVA
jgi:DNA-directed RNA polymerase subunit beta'